MIFRYTEKVSYLLLAITFASPFYVMVQVVSPEDIHLVFLAPLWQYIWFTGYDASFNVSPVALIYVFWYWPGLYITKLAYDTTKTQNRERYDYAQRIVLLMILQIIFTLVIPPAGGSPPPMNIPLPIVAVVALLLIRVTVSRLESPWEGQGDSM
jgi:hypothetical protein